MGTSLPRSSQLLYVLGIYARRLPGMRRPPPGRPVWSLDKGTASSFTESLVPCSWPGILPGHFLLNLNLPISQIPAYRPQPGLKSQFSSQLKERSKILPYSKLKRNKFSQYFKIKNRLTPCTSTADVLEWVPVKPPYIRASERGTPTYGGDICSIFH